jgi:hypothetical protein
MLVLLVDRERPDFMEALRARMGAAAAADLLALGPQRFAVVTTVDTGQKPRWMHAAELLPSFQALLIHVLQVVVVAELLASPGVQTGIDFAYALLEPERAAVNEMLDRHQQIRLAHATPEGCA